MAKRFSFTTGKRSDSLKESMPNFASEPFVEAFSCHFNKEGSWEDNGWTKIDPGSWLNPSGTFVGDGVGNIQADYNGGLQDRSGFYMNVPAGYTGSFSVSAKFSKKCFSNTHVDTCGIFLSEDIEGNPSSPMFISACVQDNQSQILSQVFNTLTSSQGIQSSTGTRTTKSPANWEFYVRIRYARVAVTYAVGPGFFIDYSYDGIVWQNFDDNRPSSGEGWTSPPKNFGVWIRSFANLNPKYANMKVHWVRFHYGSQAETFMCNATTSEGITD